MSISKLPNVEEPPMIEMVEGIGAEYLVWTRKIIVDLASRLERLEKRVAQLEEKA